MDIRLGALRAVISRMIAHAWPPAFARSGIRSAASSHCRTRAQNIEGRRITAHRGSSGTSSPARCAAGGSRSASRRVPGACDRRSSASCHDVTDRTPACRPEDSVRNRTQQRGVFCSLKRNRIQVAAPRSTNEFYERSAPSDRLTTKSVPRRCTPDRSRPDRHEPFTITIGRSHRRAAGECPRRPDSRYRSASPRRATRYPGGAWRTRNGVIAAVTTSHVEAGASSVARRCRQSASSSASTEHLCSPMLTLISHLELQFFAHARMQRTQLAKRSRAVAILSVPGTISRSDRDSRGRARRYCRYRSATRGQRARQLGCVALFDRAFDRRDTLAESVRYRSRFYSQRPSSFPWQARSTHAAGRGRAHRPSHGAAHPTGLRVATAGAAGSQRATPRAEPRD